MTGLNASIEDQLRRQAKIDTAALNRYRATVAADKVLLEAERALADDLAGVLTKLWPFSVNPERIFAEEDAEVRQVLARYRAARQ